MILSGEVLGFDGTYIRVMSEHGELTLDYRTVTCAGAACPDPETWVPEVRLSGAARLGDLILPALVEGYARSRDMAVLREDVAPGRFTYLLGNAADGPDRARFDFRATTTEDGFADLLANEADLLMAARELTPMELRLAEEAGVGRLTAPGRVRVIALDALVPVTSPARQASALRLGDLSRILSGEITDWSSLGLEPGPIRLHLGGVDGGQVQGVLARLLGTGGRSLREDVVLHPDYAEAAVAIERDPDALGLLPFASLGNTHPLDLSGGCGIVLSAGADSVRTEDYPLATPLLLYLPMRRQTPIAEEFLAWLHTTDAQFVLRRAGVLGLEAEPIPLGQQGDRLAAAIAAAGPEVTLADLQRLVTAMTGRVRLSPTFRFEEGSSQLDAASRSHVMNLAQALRDGRFPGQDLILVGFSDGRGGAPANLALARGRAEAVRDAIVSVLGGTLPEGTRLTVEAFGEALPMACDDSRWGRRVNRRVELWAGPAD